MLTDQPVDFTEPYFPTRLLTDVAFMILGNRGGDLAHLKYDGLARRPVETIVGGDGLVVGSGARPVIPGCRCAPTLAACRFPGWSGGGTRPG